MRGTIAQDSRLISHSSTVIVRHTESQLSYLPRNELVIAKEVKMITTSVQTPGTCLETHSDHCAASQAPKWKTSDPIPMTTDSLIDLLEGRTPLLKEAAFLAPDTVHRMEQELEARFTPYLNTTGPSVDKVGVAQFEFQAQKREDFESRTGQGMIVRFTICKLFLTWF